jgi:hypothetical protein
MINVLVALAFVGCWIGCARSVVRHHRAAKAPAVQSPAKGKAQAVMFADDLALIVLDTDPSAWTALDDKQVTRLLREAAA